MAQNINYGSEIKNGGTIKSEHVSQFVDAFTAVEAYDINISGSLNIVGTTSGSFIGDGSGLTGLPTGSDGSQLTTKSGNVPSSSFLPTQSNDSFATVNFTTPFSSSDYSVAVELTTTSTGLYNSLSTDFEIRGKTTSSFQVYSTFPLSIWSSFPGSSVDFIAIANTETSVFTIPTSSFGLNSKVGNVPSESFGPTNPGPPVNDYSASVTFATPFSSSDYAVSLTRVSDLGSGDSVGALQVFNKTTSGFKIQYDSQPDWESIDYIAAANGETAVTSSFTLTSATASYVEQAQTASISLNDLTLQSIQVINGTASISRELPLPDGIEAIPDSTFNAGGAPISIIGLGTNLSGRVEACNIITLPSSLRRVGNFAFLGHNLSGSFTLPSTVEFVGSSSFGNMEFTSISCSNNLTEIGNGAFYIIKDFGLTSLTLNEGLTTIHDLAFYNLYNSNVSAITDSSSFSLTIPSSVSRIGRQAFNAVQINSLTFNTPTSPLTIETQAFYGSSRWGIGNASSSIRGLESIDIPANTTLGDNVFGVQYLKTASIGENCDIGERIFSSPLLDSSINTFTLLNSVTSSRPSSLWPWYGARFNNFIFSGSAPRVYRYQNNLVSSSVSLPFSYFQETKFKGFPDISQTNISKIGSSCFSSAEFETGSLILPPSMSYNNSTFSNMNLIGLGNITSSNDYSVTIGAHSNFSYDTNFPSATIYGGVTASYSTFISADIGNLIIEDYVDFYTGSMVKRSTISNSVFRNNYIRSLTIGENVKFGKFTFYDNNTKITGSTVFPATVFIDSSSFNRFALNNTASCGFDSVVFSGSGIETISESAFQQSGINALDFVGSGIQYIEAESFIKNNITGSVTFPSTLLEIGSGAFNQNYIETASIPTACTTASDSFDGTVHVIRF